MNLYLPSVQWFALVFLISACGETEYVDVTTQSDYRNMAGATYTVVGPVNDYGIRKHSKASAESISVIPPPGIEGPEVAFRVPIPIGTSLTILNVYETNRLVDPSISLRVRLDGTVFPGDQNLPIHLDLMRGNQGTSKLSLNPEIFKKTEQ